MRRGNKTTYKYSDFDVKAFLDEYDISYKTSGKNIGSMWIGLAECPFCGVGGNHFGVNLQSKSAHCWGCGEHPNALKWVQQVLDISYSEACIIINRYSTETENLVEIRQTGNKVVLPTNMIEVNYKGLEYLESRGFGQDTIDKYKLRQCLAFSKVVIGDQKSDFSWRIFIPIYMRRELVSYTARDYTGQREPRYKHPFLEACKIPASSTIYNMDTVKDKCIILEGPTDVWRMGDECISLQGIKYTKEQIRYLSEMKLKKAVVMFDAGKEEEATELAKTLSLFVRKVLVASLPFGDPAELPSSEAVKIKYQLLNEI